MNVDSVALFLKQMGDLLWGWPLILFILGSGILMTLMFRGVQFRYFVAAWRYLITPEAAQTSTISPLQAFLNTLSASVGNGALTGMATAIYSGGPGAAFWVFVLGFFTMPIRFAEVFAGTQFTVTDPKMGVRGGPMAYITLVPGGRILAYLYVLTCLVFTLVCGDAMQANAISKGLTTTVPVLHPWLIAGALFIFLLYVVLGGAQRVLKVSDRIVPLKVGLFLIAMLIALLYHYAAIWGALKLMASYALSTQALVGGVIGYTIQDAIRFGMARSLNATEVGLGTAGILYGATQSKDPVRSGIMAMATSFISNHVVCFSIMLLIIASGAWSSGIIGPGMTIAAFSSVYGYAGGWLVTLLSMMFGLGVLVAYIFIGRECWLFLFGQRGLALYSALFCLFALFGALADVALVWNSIDLMVAGLVVINLYALLVKLPVIAQALRAYQPRE